MVRNIMAPRTFAYIHPENKVMGTIKTARLAVAGTG
jgi:hypothetical protein